MQKIRLKLHPAFFLGWIPATMAAKTYACVTALLFAIVLLAGYTGSYFDGIRIHGFDASSGATEKNVLL